MATYKVGTSSAVSRLNPSIVLAKALTARAARTRADRDSHRGPALYSPDFDADYPPVARALKQSIADVDAVLFVTPEYNRSIPGGLKTPSTGPADPGARTRLRASPPG
jgi:chromate reductase